WIDALAMLDPSRGSELAPFCVGQLLDGLDGLSISFDRWLLRQRSRFSEKTKTSREFQTAAAGKDPVPLRTEAYARHSLPGRNRLRVAVLPFEGRSAGKGAQRGDDLAFSLSHDIATALARFRWFDVITPTSFICRPLVSFTSDHLLQRKQLDYVIDGGVSRNGRLIRI